MLTAWNVLPFRDWSYQDQWNLLILTFPPCLSIYNKPFLHVQLHTITPPLSSTMYKHSELPKEWGFSISRELSPPNPSFSICMSVLSSFPTQSGQVPGDMQDVAGDTLGDYLESGPVQGSPVHEDLIPVLHDHQVIPRHSNWKCIWCFELNPDSIPHL